MELAVATDYDGYSQDGERLRHVIRAIAETGFSHVHWCHEWDGERLYPKEEIEAIRDLLQAYGVRMKGIHATEGRKYLGKEGMFKTGELEAGQSFYASLDEEERKRGEALLRNRLELAAATKTREIVLHLQLPYVLFEDESYQERFYAQAYKSLDAVKDYAMAEGIRICYENLPGTPNKWQFDQFDRLFDRYGKDFLGFCFDTGHGMITDPEDPHVFARRYTDRLFMMHLNENHGNPRPGDFSEDRHLVHCDEHHVIGDGVIDFTTFAKIVAASPYEGPVVGEFVRYGEAEEVFLTNSYQRLKEFSMQVEEFRSSLHSQTS